MKKLRQTLIVFAAGLIGYAWMKRCGRTCPECSSVFTHELAPVSPSNLRFSECYRCDHIWKVDNEDQSNHALAAVGTAHRRRP